MLLLKLRALTLAARSYALLVYVYSKYRRVTGIATNGVEEPETGHVRTIDHNSKLELKKTSRNPGST